MRKGCDEELLVGPHSQRFVMKGNKGAETSLSGKVARFMRTDIQITHLVTFFPRFDSSFILVFQLFNGN
jgi:hypothetical protein